MCELTRCLIVVLLPCFSPSLVTLCNFFPSFLSRHLSTSVSLSQTGQCEKSPETARSINVDATMNLLASVYEASYQHKQVESASSASSSSSSSVIQPVLFVHLSTDWVYDGCASLVAESQQEHTTGFGVYGQSKLKAEESMIEYLKLQETKASTHKEQTYLQLVILRSALMYGKPSPFIGKHSFLKVSIVLTVCTHNIYIK